MVKGDFWGLNEIKCVKLLIFFNRGLSLARAVN